MKKTAARDAWAEIEPSLRRILGIVMANTVKPGIDLSPEPSHAL